MGYVRVSKGAWLYFCTLLWYCIIKRLDQGHLHPKLEVQGHVPVGNPTLASAVGGEHSGKEPFEQLVNNYSEHLHMSARPVENARDNILFYKQNDAFRRGTADFACI